MRCFGKKEEKKSKVERQEKRHHSEPQSSEYWTKMSGNGVDKNIGGKRTKKRRKNNSENRRRMSLEGNAKMANGGEMTERNGGRIGHELVEEGGGSQLEFTKITERIFALLFPSGNSDSVYRQNIKSISERIKRIFPDRYKIFNLSQKRSDLGRANQQGAVLEFGWPDTLAPPLDRLCSICKQLENHLNNSPENVAIIHCKGGIYRAGIVVAAFMNYTSICSGEENLPDRFSMKLFTEKYLGPDAQPSHKRYVKYFANLLSGTTKVYPSPIFLNQIFLNKLFPNQIVKLKLYERMKPVWSSGKITLKEHAFVDLSKNRLSLRGDVLLKCYEPLKEGSEKNLIFQCQFNTCALGLDSMALPKVTFQKEDLDCIFNNKLVDIKAGFELTFELANNNIESNGSRRSNTPKSGKSASPGRANLQTGGDFSRADSYENFDRAEDDRSLSLPIENDLEKGVENNLATINGKESTTDIIGDSNQATILPSHQHTPLTTDGADSGIGSDSPKAAATTILNGQNDGNVGMLNGGEYSLIGKNEQMETKQKKMPPPVPPKVRRHSSIESVDDQQQYSHRPVIPSQPHRPHHPHDQYEPLDPNDPLRGAIEDSTIGRDHSVLPPGARPNRRHSTHTPHDANSGSSGDEANRAPSQRRVIISPMVQPELVASGRYDPNSRCFSYVSAKSLKAHYQTPKKPTLKRRTSIVEPADLNGSSSDLRRRAETPKWDAEIDKVAGKIELDRRPRRTSTSGTHVGHLQRDYIRSPSAQIRPQDEWRHRNQYQQQQQYRPIQSSPPHWNWPSSAGDQHRTTTFIPNGYIPTERSGVGGSGWSTPINAHTMPRMAQSPRAENEFHPMAASMPAERPMVIEQAKRAAPSPVTHFSTQIHPGKRIPGVRPSPRRSEMDELCDPDFYFSYSTPTSSPVLGRKQQSVQQKEDTRRMQAGELLSKSVPNNRAFKQIVQNELLRDDVRNLLAEHTMPIHFRSQTPQTTMMIANQRNKYLPSQGGINEEFRTRNCRSVNSTPLIGGRKLFVHNDSDEAATDPEGAEGWLHAKLAAVKNKRYMEPVAKNRREAEKMLLEELKSKAAKLVKGAGGGGDDPLEDYRREEQRLKNTHSPLVLDGLRQANRNLQKERAKQGYYGLKNPQQSPMLQPIAKSFPSGTQYQGPCQIRSLSATPGAGIIGINPIGGIRSFQQNNVPIAESPTPSVNIRRGATPTSQIVRGKPPTPPPTRIDRERSKSPYSGKLLRGTSNSAPPFGKRMAEEEEEIADVEGGGTSSAVNPNLLALRQSLYAKERERMGIKGGGGGVDNIDIDDWMDENTNEFGEEKQQQRKWTTTSNTAARPQYLQQLINSQLATNNPSTSTFAYGGTNQNGGGTNRSTPVKPILKRTNNANGGTNGGNESPLLMQKKTLPMNLAPNHQQQNAQTLNEESSFRQPISGPNPNSSNHPSTNWLVERSDTPQFPILPERETPLPYHPLLYRVGGDDHPPQQGTTMPPTAKIGGNSATLPFAAVGPNNGGLNNINNNNSTRFGAMTPHSIYGGHGPTSGFSRRSSLTSIDAGEVIHHHPIFVKDTSRFWYKPTISREEAINMLKNKAPGTFVVRDSNSFPGAFGLALKVAQPPAGVTPTDGSELVRHFLIEPSIKGVRLKGCSNEPVFGTLAALVYQHSITPLALPCRLILPEYDPASSPEHINSNQALLERGAACNVTYLCSVDTESLTGPEAVRRSAAFAFEMLHRRELRAVPIHFKVSSQGITLTDNTRSLFFRRHYPVNSVTFAGIDPESRVFDNNNVAQLPPTYVRQAPIFGYVARKLPSNGFSGSVENACHIFAELDPDQPASAVVRFITNVMMPAGRSQLQQIHQNANIH